MIEVQTGAGAYTGDYYAGLIKVMRGFDKDLERQLSKRISESARPVVADMRNAVKGVSSEARFEGFSKNTRPARRGRGGSGASRRADFATRGVTTDYADAVASGRRVVSRRTWDRRRLQARSLRAQVAAGVRLVNRKTGDGAGVLIRTSASKLPADQKALPRAMNRGKWRHPFFGNRELWVEQTVRPKGWFTDTGKKRHPQLRAAITQALDDAVMDLAIKGRQ